jgi:hypothetical protein
MPFPSMPRISTVAFIFSIIGATYQLVSYSILAFAEPRSTFYYFIAFQSPVFLSLAVFWLASHLFEDHRVIWPTMIFAIAVSTLLNLFIIYLTPASYSSFIGYPNVSPTGLLILVPAPLLVLAGGILGFAASTLTLRDRQTTTSMTSQSKLS